MLVSVASYPLWLHWRPVGEWLAREDNARRLATHLQGLGGVLLASLLIQALRGQWSIHEILITFFIFLTAPVSANLMAKAALHLRVESKAGHQPVDEADAATPRQG